TIAKEREELLRSRRSEPNLSRLSSSDGHQPLGDAATVLMMDGLLHEQDVLVSSGSRLDDYITIGRNALTELYEQRNILKSTQRRMLDVATTLGLSTTVIRYIEQRTQQDKWILWGGMAVTVFLFWVILRAFG
ncbi:protein transport protein bos1, partial [Cladochytrium tenue]